MIARCVVLVWVRLLDVLTEVLALCHRLLKTNASIVHLVRTELCIAHLWLKR